MSAPRKSMWLFTHWLQQDMYQYLGYAFATSGASLLIPVWTIITFCIALSQIFTLSTMPGANDCNFPVHEWKTYLNSISCWNKWSHCFLCVDYFGLVISKFLHPIYPVLCCLPDICSNSLLKCKVFLICLSLLYELWSHPCNEPMWQVFFHNHVHLLHHLYVACTLQKFPQAFSLCCCNCSYANIQLFGF